MNKILTLFIAVLTAVGTADAKLSPLNAAEDLTQVIYDAPEGNVTRLNHSGNGYMSYNIVDYSYAPAEIVECDNGEVYLKNPLGVRATDSYIKGHKEGNQYVFNLPQAISMQDFGGEMDYFVLSKMQSFIDEYGIEQFYIANSEDARYHGLPEIENTFVININDDGSLSYRSQDSGKTIIGYYSSYDMLWYGYGDITADWTVFTDVPVTVPDDIEPVEMVIESAGDVHFGKAVFADDNNEIYIQGIFDEAPEAWIKGSFDGNQASFASGQYLGEYPEYGSYTYFVAAAVEQKLNEEYQEWYDVLKLQDSIVFEYDSEKETFTSAADNAIVFNKAPDQIQAISYQKNVVIRNRGEVSPQIANPSELYFKDEIDSFGYSSFGFKLASVNIDGEPLNTDNIYYSIFVNGEEFVFTPDVYMNVEKDMSLIPYDYTDGYDFSAWDSNRTVFFYTKDIYSIGVKEYYVYTDGDEELTTESDLVTVDLSGVEKVTEDNDISGIEYYNVAGQKVTGPDKGIFIKKVNYTDGTSSVFKVIRK